MKKITFQQFKHDALSDDDAFNKLLGKTKQLSCLEQDNGQMGEILCNIISKGVEY